MVYMLLRMHLGLSPRPQYQALKFVLWTQDYFRRVSQEDVKALLSLLSDPASDPDLLVPELGPHPDTLTSAAASVPGSKQKIDDFTDRVRGMGCPISIIPCRIICFVGIFQ